MRIFIAAIIFFVNFSAAVAAITIEEQRDFGNGPRLVRVLSTIDTDIIAPVIEGFLETAPDFRIEYGTANTQDVFDAIGTEQNSYDIVISSAMDLQMKLANDGFAQPVSSAAIRALPNWARWRDVLVAIAQEPVMAVLNRDAFAGLGIPQTRADLAAILRTHPDRFRNKLGTYDPVRSGAGYLFASQDARYSDTFWRLAEIMGGLRVQLYTTSSAMIDDVKTGKIAAAYNVVGSYAMAHLSGNSDVQLVEFRDFTHILLRTALVPVSATHADNAAVFLDYLVSDAGQKSIDELAKLPRISEESLIARPHQKPIRLDPGLLVYVDPIKRKNFLSEWMAAVLQP